MKKSKKILIGVVLLISFVIFQIYMTTSPNNIIENIRESYKGVVISRKQIAQRESHLTRIFSKINNKTTEDIFRSELDSIIDVGDSVIKPANENYIYLIKPNGKRKKYIYTFISKDTREDFRWPKEWKGRWTNDTIK